MNTLSFYDYFQEGFFPISVTVMPASGTSKVRNSLHTHEFSEIVLVGKGSLMHHTEHSDIRLEKGNFFLMHPGMAHEYSEPSKDALLYNLIYDSRAPIPMLTATNLAFVRSIYPDEYVETDFGLWSIAKIEGKNLREVIAAMDKIRAEVKKRNPGHHIRIAALFMEIIIELARNFHGEVKDNCNWTLNQVVGFIQCHYREKIGVKDLTRIAMMSESSLFRRFKTAFGVGPGEYLMNLRIRQAVTLLKKRDIKLESIAAECGFCNSSHLWKALYRKLRKTPAEIRKEADQ